MGQILRRSCGCFLDGVWWSSRRELGVSVSPLPVVDLGGRKERHEEIVFEFGIVIQGRDFLRPCR